MLEQSPPDTEPLLSVRDLSVSIPTDEGIAHILDNAEVVVKRGLIVGVVGESGCGKTTLIKSILGTLPRTATISHGSIRFDGDNLLELSEREMSRRIRGSKIGFIPQDPYLALNPVFRVGTQLLEIMRWHDPDRIKYKSAKFSRAARRRDRNTLLEFLRLVQMPDPEETLQRYPHQFSGGQRQRLLIAGALACRPRLIIADEPTTALDVTTQLQILNLLKQLVSDLGISMLLVTHDFGVVAQLCDEINVMYAGQSMEYGSTEECLERPRHPYTEALINCHPDRSEELAGIPGTVPSALTPPSGCRFHPRCSVSNDRCKIQRPAASVDELGHTVACVLHSHG